VRTVEIFLSSPADVAEERFIARGVSERLQGELAGYLKLETVLWEFEPLLASGDYQSQIPHGVGATAEAATLFERALRVQRDYLEPQHPSVVRHAAEFECRFATAATAQSTP